MLPSVVSREVMEAVQQQLKAQFPSTTAGFLRNDNSASVKAAIDDLLDRPGDVFKGPYLSFGLPFRKAAESDVLPFQHLSIPYTPYLHQMKAFQRLTGPSPQPTLVATGTGSGKTECFMYPLLDHCAATKAPGVKALIIYPMNALAQDQARRFAEEVHAQDGLRGKVTVGLYTGDSSRGRTVMSADSVITDRDTQQKNPPDILLTNYRMLDFLLIRPKDRKLWRHNEPGMLRYLVVDELHTFDGAQGTDLACLVRRLKDRLECSDELACVGTSATVGDDLESLTNYASNVFDTRFREDSVLREERLTAAEFLPQDSVQPWPDKEQVKDFTEQPKADQQSYIRNAAALWFTENKFQSINFAAPETLGDSIAQNLASLAPFREFLTVACEIVDKSELIQRCQQRWQVSIDQATAAFDALIALCSVARDDRHPYVTVREQLWLRELRRMVATVSTKPELRFRDDLKEDRTSEGINGEPGAITLPVVHCNSCHATGWLSQRQITRKELLRDIHAIYEGFFSSRPDTVTIYPDLNVPPVRRSSYYRLCSNCGTLNLREKSQVAEVPEATGCENCDSDSDALVDVVLPDMNRERTENGAGTLRFYNCCPYCEAVDTLFILGSRAATLSSVAINSLFNSQFNDHNKLIAFSDSVQDAAHRAGFFAARTYNDVIRAALTVAVSNGEFKTLDKLIDGVGDYWKKRFEDSKEGDGSFIATFLPPDLLWLRDWDELQQTDILPPKSDLVERWIIPRLRWEALSAFGLKSRKGRTIERTGRAIVYPDPDLLGKLVENVLAQLTEEVAELRDLEAHVLQQFVLGVLWQLRTRGAFYDGVLEGYIQSGGDIYRLRRNNYQAYLPPLGKRSNPPAFLSLRKLGGKNARRFDTVMDSGGTWYSQWFDKVLSGNSATASASVDVVYSILMRSAVKLGLISSTDVRDQDVWSLCPSHWGLTSDVITMVCEKCRHRVQVAGNEENMWQEMPCVRSHCDGKCISEVSRLSQPKQSNDGTPVRLISAEHSAVLDSDTRSRVEKSFKRNPGTHWDINLLSATPTMEMGVDIGDLSSVLLCSVPPSQANYLQRIGRAGRKDGNAFNLTIATGAPHDLFFYSKPIEMMAGHVNPPGVFLEAIAVLERQLLAYCMDRWVQSDIPDDAIPDKLKVVLDAVDNGSEKLFPHNFLQYVDRERGLILTDFQNLFRRLQSRRSKEISTSSGLFKGLTAEGINQLNDYLHGRYGVSGGIPGIVMRLTTLFENKASQRKRLRKDIDQLKRDIDRLEQLPEDESRNANLAEVSAERAAILRLVRTMNRQLTLNFLTDEGVLPNYSFPEEGVKLNSVIYRKRERAQSEEDGKAYDKIELEIRRPAQVALRELAPHSRFYGNSRQVQIDQVMVGKDDVENWRFCANCNYGVSVALNDEFSTCPRCSHADWQSSEQRITLLKLREVYANASDRESRIGDDSDDREPVFFNRQFLFDIDPEAIERAWRIEEPTCPFGFEYLSKATFREINFGRKSDHGPTIQLAGNNSPRSGFQVCKHCGKVRMWRQRQEDNHTRRCQMYGLDDETQTHPDNLWSALYLYRELRSEAVRILLPLADLAQSETRLQSFIAAVHLGLKNHFHGNVDHLQVMYVSEPVVGTSLRRHFLVLFDSVPGGTGYLSEISANPSVFKGVIEHARKTMQDCECQENPQADGCYRCLYAYRSSHQMQSISRNAASDTIDTILSHWDSLAELDKGDSLNHTVMNSLYDSELEMRFISSLSSTRGCKIDERRSGTKTGYELSIDCNAMLNQFGINFDSSAKYTRWHIELQVNLNEVDNVAVACKPDFILRCLSVDESLAPPIAIFMDGFEFHRDIQAEDTAKRFAILTSDRYRVWTLGWHDLPDDKAENEMVLDSWFTQPQDKAIIDTLFDKIAKQMGLPAYGQQNDITRGASFQHLLQLLAEPVATTNAFSHWAVSRAFGLTDLTSSQNQENTLQQVGAWLPVPWQEKYLKNLSLIGSCDLFGIPKVLAVTGITETDIEAFSAATPTNKVDFSTMNISLCLLLDDRQIEAEGYQDSWRRFWASANLLQFLPAFLPACHTGIEDQVYAPVIEYGQGNLKKGSDPTIKDVSGSIDLEKWGAALEGTFYAEQLTQLVMRGAPIPKVGEDIKNGDVIVASAEWSWPDLQVAFVEHTDSKALKSLQSMGWRVIKSIDQTEIDEVIDYLVGA